MKKLLLLVFMISTAHAGVLVEPYLGYRFGSGEIDVTNSGLLNGTYKYALSGYNLGGRLGYSFLGVFGALDYSIGKLEEESDGTPAGVTVTDKKDEYDTTNIGLTVGYEFPVFLRAWGTYFLKSELEETTDSNPDTYEGSGFGVGIGFTSIPIIDLNLEIRKFSYDEVTDNSGTTSLPSNTASELETTEIMLSVSAPFDF